MDDIVKRAMAKWPNVPNVHGWLRLDCRGDWLLRMAPGVFDPIRNPGIVEFINRNYHADERGRWFFQNGPQRVFVALDCTPHVYRLDDRRAAWLAHTGEPAGQPLELLLDENDALLLVTALGPGVVLDRDLEWLLDHLRDEAGAPLEAEAFIERAQAGALGRVQLPGGTARVARVQKAQLAVRYGFDPDPQDLVTPAQDLATPAQDLATPAQELATPAQELATLAQDLVTPAQDHATPAQHDATAAPPDAAVAQAETK